MLLDIMKKIVAFLMLMASVAVMTCCMAEDPFEEYNNDWNNNSITPNGNTGNSSTTGELTAFDVAPAVPMARVSRRRKNSASRVARWPRMPMTTLSTRRAI